MKGAKVGRARDLSRSLLVSRVVVRKCENLDLVRADMGWLL